MTRSKSARSKKSASRPGRWSLQDAKARFSELVRRARSEWPQHATVRARGEVVIVAAEELRRLQG
jgi:prevent-host-death family protein